MKLSHKQFRAQLKKCRRKEKRQAAAKQRQEEDRDACAAADEVFVAEAECLAEEELRVAEEEERERECRHREWLAREAIAQEEFRKLKAKEEQIRQENEKKERKIREEWEQLQQREKQLKEQQDAEVQERKDREAALLKEATQHLTNEQRSWNNPTAPANYGTELDKQNCPFYVKTGACRFGERCSRTHPRPPVTRTILIPGMFTHFSLDKILRDEYDTDTGLEYDDNECYLHFRDFYDDVLPEFKKAGCMTQFKVCRNYEPHLRGNVYVQFETEEEAMAAYRMFNGRYYAGKQLSCRFTSITKWKSAICGLYHRNRCPKGRSCNFLHVFVNPNNEFHLADRDLSPLRKNADRRNSGSRRHSRSDSKRSSRRSRSSDRHHGSRSKRRRSVSRKDRRRRRSRSRDSSKRRRRRHHSRSFSRSASAESNNSGKQNSHRKSRRHKRSKKIRRSPSKTEESCQNVTESDEVKGM